MNVIVIREDEQGILVVVQIPEGSTGEETYNRWAADDDFLDDMDLDLYWEELQVIETE